MSDNPVRKVIVCVLLALLTFAFVWGVYIMVLMIGLNTQGDASYAAAVSVAMVMQMIIYKLARFKLSRRPRWLACAAGVLPIMGIFSLVFKGGGNFEMLGSSFNRTLFLAMCGFAVVTLIYEIFRRLLYGKEVTLEPEETQNEEQQESENVPAENNK